MFKNVTPGRRDYISAFYRPQRRKVMFSVHGVGGGGVSVPACITGHTGLCRGGLCPWVVSVWGGLCQGTPPRETPLYGNERAVRILLECILVIVSTCVDLQMEAKLKLEKEKKKKKQRW